jgi:two-component system cell cycle response regulator
MNILIADDDPVSRRRLEVTLTRLGHAPVPVSDGGAALAALAAPDSPRLAILDWMMPVASGLEVCRALRRRPAPYVYVILLTSRDRREDMVAALEADADDFLTKPFDAVELRARLRSGARVLELQESLLAAQEGLRFQATHDPLTDLWNRAQVLAELERELARQARHGGALAVALADLDHFKWVNDTHGHAAGDAVLRQAAQRMRQALRNCDLLGRYGGEEFLIVLPGCDLAAAACGAERLRELIAARPMRAGELLLPVRVSIGVAAGDGEVRDPACLIAAADQALYRAKELGRNRVALAVDSPWSVVQGAASHG